MRLKILAIGAVSLGLLTITSATISVTRAMPMPSLGSMATDSGKVVEARVIYRCPRYGHRGGYASHQRYAPYARGYSYDEERGSHRRYGARHERSRTYATERHEGVRAGGRVYGEGGERLGTGRSSTKTMKATPMKENEQFRPGGGAAGKTDLSPNAKTGTEGRSVHPGSNASKATGGTQPSSNPPKNASERGGAPKGGASGQTP